MTPLIPESGVFIPTVSLGAILDQSSRDPNTLFHKLVDHFFSQEMLAMSTATSQRVSKSLKRPLDQKIVKSIEGEQTSHDDFICLDLYIIISSLCVCISTWFNIYCGPHIYL